MTDIERQLCDILGLTSEHQLAAEVKSLHDRFGYHVMPNRAVIPCFCGDITRITREKLGASPREPVFSAAERVVKERDAALKRVFRLERIIQHFDDFR